ncbi:MAG TPA: TolC family protein, partial [Polyangiaceae bacterium]|nr:TolC family protein [Polyangiaceae bacterium]
MRAAVIALGVCLGAAPTSARAAEGSLTMEQAVAVALLRNRDVIAAKLEIRAAELDQVAAEVYPNPVLSYSLGNLPVGAGNVDNAKAGAPAHPGFFAQPVQTIAMSEIIDVWSKRSARVRAAERGVELRRLEVEDALREIVYGVRSAFAEVERELSERQLSHEMRDRYDQTIRLSRARFSAGEISEAESRKVLLEGLKYQIHEVEAEAEYDVARQRLAALLGLGSESELAEQLSDDGAWNLDAPVPTLVSRALEHRPDVRAVERARAYAVALLGAAKREAYPDISVGLSYTHSDFTASGDNPNAFGIGLSLPLPIFDRNQANIGRAELAIRR